MSRRKVILPSWAVSSGTSKDIVALNERFPDLSKGELIINTKEENVTLTTLDEAGKVSNFISEDKIDEKITDVSKSFNDEIKTKQDAIEDLDSIRSGAALGATALQEVPVGYATEKWVENKEYATESFVTNAIATVPTKTSDLTNDSGFITINDVPSIDIPENILTEDDLDDYATTQWVEDQNYLTEHQDISGKQDVIDDLESIRRGATLGASALQTVPEEYAKKTDLPSLSGVATEQWVKEQGYLTEHQDISGKQDEIKDIETIRDGASKGATALQEIPSEYVTENELNAKGYLTEHQSLEGLATEQWVEDKGYLTEHQDLSEYAKKTDIPSLEGYATTQWVEGQGYLTEHQSLEGLATEDWVEGKGYLTKHQDISHLATKGEIPSLEGLASESWVKGAITESYEDSVAYIDGEISKLVDTDTDKTIREIANEELAAQLITSSATESMNELKEIAAWIQSHPKDAAAMNLSISALSGLSHTHGNKTIINGISENDIYNWNNPTYALSAGTSKDIYAFDLTKYVDGTTITNGQKRIQTTLSSEEIDNIKSAKNVIVKLTSEVFLPCDLIIKQNEDNISLNAMAFMCYGINEHNIPLYVSEGATIDINTNTMEAGIIITYTYFNHEAMTALSADTSNSAKTSEMLQCVMSDEYGTYEGSIKFDVKNIYAETNQLELDVDTNINFKKTACFENNIHLGKNAPDSEESLIGGAICFGDDFHSVDGESYPMTYIKEEENNVLDIVAPDGINLKASKINIGNNFSIDGSEMTLLVSNISDSDGSEEEVILHAFTDNEGVGKLDIGVEVNALSIKSNNVPNSVKFNGATKQVLNGTVDLGDLINSANTSISATTSKIADEARYVNAMDIDGILGVEHLPIGTTSGSVASGDHTHIEIGSMLNDISGSVASLFTKTDENAENIEDQGLVLQDYNETLTNHEERIQTAEATLLSNESRLDKIEDNVLVLNETRGSKVVSLRSFHLNELSCLTQAPDTIYLGKINGGDYIRPNSNLNGVTIVNETFAPNWGSSIGYDGFCNNITVEAENISYINLLNITRPYLICKVTNANCVLPHSTISTGITKSFGLMRSNLKVSGITGTNYYSYPIYSGDTIAIPLSSDNLMSSNFIYENEIGTIWDSGEISVESIYFLYGMSSLVLMSKIYDYDIYASYGQEITGSMDDTNLPIDKDIIIDNIEGIHDLILPSSPKVGKKYNIISKANRCTLDGNGKIIYQNYTLDTTAIAGYNKLSLKNKVSNCIYDGTTWYLY